MPAAVGTTVDYQLPIDFSYEVDLWGRVRRNVEASVATAQATGADVQTALLSSRAELAVDYFELRGLDAQIELLGTTIAAFERAVQLTSARHDQGVASGVDVAQAQTQLDTTRVQATDLEVARAQFEHAIAILVGKGASGSDDPTGSGDRCVRHPQFRSRFPRGWWNDGRMSRQPNGASLQRTRRSESPRRRSSRRWR